MHRARWAMSMALGAVLLAGACGGSSEQTTFNAPSDAGSGGSSSTSGGSDGSAGEPDEQSAGGSSAGTSSTAGSAALAGAPSTPFTPDPAVRQGCPGWCEGVVAAACDAETQEDCEFWCRAVANSPACNALYGELFECAEGATFSCNDDGDAVPQGCEVEYIQAGVCVLSNPDETIEQPCQSYCTAAEEAQCANTTPAAECTYGCQLNGALVPACAEGWKSFIECAETSPVACNDEGDPYPSSCIAPYLEYLACLVEAGQ